jgi:hypothetical protein
MAAAVLAYAAAMAVRQGNDPGGQARQPLLGVALPPAILAQVPAGT